MKAKNHTDLYREVVAGFVGSEDPLLEMLKWTMQQMMAIEAEQKVGASKHVHSEDRSTHFSGYRLRRFDTRLGTAYLAIPKLRKGGYVPFFLTEKRRSEQALLTMVQEAFVNGVSTRKIERIAQAMGIENISASQVSEINKGLDAQVEAFRTRPLNEEYPFVWVDALYEKIRNPEGRIVSTAIMIAYGVNREGNREVLAIEPMPSESTETWKDFFFKLKQRGVQKIALLISDAHQGIRSGAEQVFAGCGWQRCKVHFMRNILAYVSPKEKEKFAAKLKQIWLQENKEAALAIAHLLIEEYRKRFPEAIEKLEMGLEDSLQFYHFEQIDKRRIASTNTLERLNKEVRRRSKVVGVFPSKESYIRLITCYLMEFTEEWEVEKRYICPDKLTLVMEKHEELQLAA